MNRYETVLIIDPDANEADEQAILDRIRTLISQDGGRLIVFDDWGRRKFAYEIQKKKQGHYIRIEYGGSGNLVSAIERFFKIDTRVIKFMTINLESGLDPASLPEQEPETSLGASVSEEKPVKESTAETADETEVGATTEAKAAEAADSEAREA
jgi:small subunit ribosomal protein S6